MSRGPAGEGETPADVSREQLVRAYADGEDWAVKRIEAGGSEPGGGEAATGEAAAGAVSLSEAERSRVAFERGLREAVGRAMSAAGGAEARAEVSGGAGAGARAGGSGDAEPVRAPDDLRAAVVAAMAQADVSGPGSLASDATDASERMVAGSEETDGAGVPLALAGSEAESKRLAIGSVGGVMRRRLGSLAALAAVLALCAGLVFMSMSRADGPWDATRVQRVSQFITAEHDRVDDLSAAYSSKFGEACSVAVARERAAAELGASPEWFAERVDALLGRDYELMGASRCNVPGGPSVHLLFKPTGGERSGAPVSVFIQAPTEAGMEAGTCWECPAAKAADAPLHVWRTNGYLIYVHANEAESLAAAREAFGAPTRLRTF